MSAHSARIATSAIITAVLLLVPGPPAQAQPAEAFFKGATLKILIGHPPGGSYDFYARLAANHLKRFLPGNPLTIVEGRPGGGGIRAVQYFYAQAPRDGSMMGLFFHGIPNVQVLEPNLGKWRMEDMRFIGSMIPANNIFIINQKAKARTADEMKNTETVVACSGHASDTYQAPAILRNLAGFKFKTICGYPGSTETLLAVTRGEVDMTSVNWSTLRVTHMNEISNGTLTPVFQYGLARMKDLPKVPLMQDLVDDAKTRAIIDFAAGGSAIGRALILPPGVPEDRLQMLRSAFDRMVVDPEFLKEAEKLRLDIEPRSGADTQRVAVSIVTAPREIVSAAAKAME